MIKMASVAVVAVALPVGFFACALLVLGLL
jgi:hypothetical protein